MALHQLKAGLKAAIPSAITSCSILCGFWAMTICAESPSPRDLINAALLLMACFFFDVMDGRAARKLGVQSAFGVELDSLADVSSFGMAPALLAYKWALAPLGLTGKLVAFAFGLCGALRLARFNVMAHQPGSGGGASRYFTGLPIPLAAGTLAASVIAHAEAGMRFTSWGRGLTVAGILLLALLMVSTVPYRTFKDVKPEPKLFLVLAALGVFAGVVTLVGSPSWILPTLCVGYIVLGVGKAVMLTR